MLRETANRRNAMRNTESRALPQIIVSIIR